LRHRKKRKKDQAAIYEEVLQEFPKGKPVCAHYGECGGCNLQDYAYEDQVEAKLRVFKEMVEAKRMTRYFECGITSLASPRQTAYRQKMDFITSFGLSGQRGSSYSDIVELSECHLIEKESFDLYKKALAITAEHNLQHYSITEHFGFLRYITVRRTRVGHQLISFLTSSMDHAEEMEQIAAKLLALGVDSVAWQLAGGKGDSQFGSPYKTWGLEVIEEGMLGKRFKLATNTFFQSNQEVAEKAYDMIKSHAAAFQPQTILDLYSGTCTIGISLADLAEKVTAVENFLPNRDMALKNFELNDVTNIEYIDKDVAEYMIECSESPDFAVCNPPRSGVDERPLRKLMELHPKGISYLSCNPKSLLEDLSIMSRYYQIESAMVLDMFPQTRHFETLVHLKRKDL
jgi:23S rRNA (uracil1939-C5)-methyltransferase